MSLLANRDEVFVAGGQPTITYVVRESDHVERQFARAMATPNQIVSLAGPTKTGKTVLCKRVLGERQYIWIDGGQVKDGLSFWDAVCAELSLPQETETSDGKQTELGLEGSVPLVTTAKGSRMYATTRTERRVVATPANAMNHMVSNKVILVVDDFHYLTEDVRTEIMRNLKGAVFNGLKVILLSVTHRVFDAIKAETELTGRFTAISLPHWSVGDLREIPRLGFDALGVNCPASIVDRLCVEAQESPFLMQKFCWEICFDCGIESYKILGKNKIDQNYDLDSMFKQIAKDAGLPIYQKLAAGPQSRKVRAKRPLVSGEEADIYQVILLALADTGPKAVVPYDELRTALNSLLTDKIPQKHEITSALKHLANISREIGAESAIDWDDSRREVNLAEPYLRFFLRWRIKRKAK